MNVRRALASTALGLLTLGLVTVPARAAQPEAELSLSSATVNAGETVVVTETITNIGQGSILNPTARLFSKPTPITQYTTLTGCTGAASCTTVDGPDGPIGYQAILAEAMSGFESHTVTFTLAIAPDAPNLTETLQGQLLGRNYGIEPVDGPTLTVNAKADAAAGLTATPKFGLLVPRLDFTVRATNHGPGTLRDATFTTTLPGGFTATTANPACVPSTGKLTCTVTSLPSGSTATFGFSVPLRLLSLGIPYSFTTTRTASATLDENPANDSASASCTVVTPLLVSCG